MKRLLATIALAFIGFTTTAWPVLAGEGVTCKNGGAEICICASDCNKPGDTVVGTCTAPGPCTPPTNAPVKPGNIPTEGSLGLSKPLLSIPIPTVSLSKVPGGQTITIPWLAEYIGGVYRYSVGVAMLLATVMITVGGAQYLLAGGNPGQVSAAKTRISDAVLGLLTVLFAYVVLNAINPDLTVLKTLTITVAKQIKFSGIEPREASGPGRFTPGKGADPKFVEALKAAAREKGFDGCVVLAICQHETNLQINRWNGDYAGTPKEKGGYFGCGMGWVNFLPPRGSAWKAVKDKFPDLVPKAEDAPFTGAKRKEWRDKIVEAMTTNYEFMAMGTVGAMKAVSAHTIAGLDSYASGGAGSREWRKATGCSGTISVKDGAKDPGTAMQRGCVPEGMIEVPLNGRPFRCTCDQYMCRNAKANSAAEFRGDCCGQDCVAMDSGNLVKYVLAQYANLNAKYQCAQ